MPVQHILHILDSLATAIVFVFTPCICSRIHVTGCSGFARKLVTGWRQSEYWGLGDWVWLGWGLGLGVGFIWGTLILIGY